MVEGVRRIGCITVCASCLRPDDDMRSKGFFGDYSLCSRCHRVQTSKDVAHWILPP